MLFCVLYVLDFCRFFVPVVNPDGYYHTHTVDRMWRKNRARFGNTITGVDLNRNFGLVYKNDTNIVF